jgi:putative ABC transport system ATP-binding protein
MSEVLLRLKNVSRTFKLDGVEVQAINNIDLEIFKGELVSIMGPSGSGKSTLMYLLGLLDKPTSGEIILNGRNVENLSANEVARIRNKEIGFVFQSFNLLPRTTALENVCLPMIYAGTERPQRLNRARDTLVKLGLSNRLNHFPSQLSGGQQQKVAIARALANDPSLILADEPTGNVDTKSGRDIMEILRGLNKDGKTVIIVTHNFEIAKKTKRIIRLIDGKILN